MDCAKSIDEIYDEVKDYDLVVTNDAALATALNGRVDKPMIGSFAVTPKMIAGLVGHEVIDKTPMRELKVITAVSMETDLDFRYVHSEIENLKEIRKHTMSVEKYLYGKRSKRIWESYSKMPTQLRIMDKFDPNIHRFYDQFERIAVIGLDLFNDLDKHFIPLDFTPIDLFKDGDYEIETIYEIGNDRQIAENAVSLIDAENAQDFAIVLNSDSALTDAVRAALYRRNIPFVNSLNVKDLTQIRDYLQFLSMSLSFETIRVKHVRELLMSYNVFLGDNKDNVLLHKILEDEINEKYRPYIELMRDIRKYTFGEVVNKLGHAGTPQIRMLLEDMDLTDRAVSSKLVSDLVYAVNNVTDLRHNEEIPENERKGVLITDCANSVYVDRPVVLFLGMEQDWNVPVIGKPYLDAEEETEKNTLRLKLLIQQGDKRVYCVNTTKNGKKARPSLTFDNIYGKSAETFDLICSNLVHGRWVEEEHGVAFEKGSVELDPNYEFYGAFSKSTFSSYMECPRKFMFKVLMPGQDEKSTEFGNLVHEFAELYACYPDIVKSKGIEYFVDTMSDKYAGLSSTQMEAIDHDRIRLAIVNIMRFLDKYGMTGLPLDVNNSMKDYPNSLMQMLGLDMTSSACETEDHPSKIPIHGIYDLYHHGVVIDYKTGKAPKYEDVVKKMDAESKSKYLDYQPLFYLALSQDRPDNRGTFDLFYALDNEIESIEPNFDINRNIRKVFTVQENPVDTFLHSESLKKWIDVSIKHLEGESERIIEAFGRHRVENIEDWVENQALINEVYEIGQEYSDKKEDYTRKMAQKAVADVVKRYQNAMLVSNDCIEIPQERLDDFIRMVKEKHDDVIEQSRTSLPCTPRQDCKECEYYYACMANIDTMNDEEEH